MGSAYPTIAADAAARFQRLQGKKVAFLTGTDEHGEKIALAAAKNGLTPPEHCDKIVEEYKALWQKLDISYDSFIRTTDSHHERLVAEVLERVWAKGDIYKADYEGWYCVDCEEYKDEKEMDAVHNCPIHKKPCQYRNEENYFFRLSKYQKELEDLVIQRSNFVEPSYRRNEVAEWVKEGARDFSISRSAVKWGIPLPQDPGHTVYVWFDALNGYLSGLLPPGVDPSLQAVQDHGWPADVHIIGKDILRFHAVYWPAMLLSAGLPVPTKVYGHGFLTKDGLKMGKSLGNVLDPVTLVDTYGADAVRYYFMKEVAFGQDGNFSEGHFQEIVNSGLANNVGNMLNRTLNLLKKNYQSALPVSSTLISEDHCLREVVTTKVPEISRAYNTLKFHLACEGALAIATRGNQYLEEMAPWTALKKGNEEQKAEAGKVLVAVLETARILALALLPITPSLSNKILTQLGCDQDALSWGDTTWGKLQQGHKTAPPQPVFVRIDCPFVTEPAEKARAPVTSA